jgi:BirA family biotin operon repressor/biotin-[acetyl-CoA-carboxylase] ligase
MMDPHRELGYPLIHLERTTSTMDEVAHRAPEFSEGLTVVAAEQSRGRGRGNRHWRSEPGAGLLFSTLLRPACPVETFQTFPLLAGLAVSESIQTCSGIRAQLKWPNDVLIDGRKVAGLLVTTTVAEGWVPQAIVGIGINMLRVPDDRAGQAISLEEASKRRLNADALLGQTLASLSTIYTQVLAGSVRTLLERWIERAAYLGEHVEIVDADNRIAGRFSGITENGALVLQIGPDSVREVYAGDLVRGPVPVISHQR